MRGKTVEITCKCGCNRSKLVREADVKRGWGKFYSKSCKAKYQENKTEQYSKYISRSHSRTVYDEFDHRLYESDGLDEPECWDEHKC